MISQDIQNRKSALFLKQIENLRELLKVKSILLALCLVLSSLGHSMENPITPKNIPSFVENSYKIHPLSKLNNRALPPEICNNGIDDDGDGLIDGLDPDCTVSCNTPEFNFSNPTLVSGTANNVGAIYKFANVLPGVDARVTIVSKSHTNINITSLDEPAATNGGYEWAFQPIIDYNYLKSAGGMEPAGEKFVTFKFDFVYTGTTVPTQVEQVKMTALDVDGNAVSVREYVKASGFNGYQLQVPTSLTISESLKAVGGLPAYAGVDETALTGMISFTYNNVTTITVNYGSTFNGSTHTNAAEVRLNSLNFKCYEFNTFVSCPDATITGSNLICAGQSTTLSAVVLNPNSRIRPANSYMCLGNNNNTASNQPINQYLCSTSNDFFWKFYLIPGTTDRYYIENVASAKKLQTLNESNADGTSVVQNTGTGSSYEWQIVQIEVGKYFVKHVASGRYLNVLSSSQSSGAAIVINSYTGNLNQQLFIDNSALPLSNYSYTWSTGAQTSSITVSPVVNTVYSVSILDVNSCEAVRQTTVLVNSSTPVSITGSSSICIGATTTLSPSSGGTWTSSNLSVATVNNSGLVTAISAGTANFTFTNTSNGCVSNPTSNVTVNTRPTISITGPTSICVGSASTLSPTTGGTWVSSNISIATITSAGVVTGISAGSATFTFTQTSTGCVSNASSAITITPRPTVSITGPNPICVGSSSTLSPSTGGTWTSSNTSFATVTNAGIVTGIAAGTATFTFTQTSSGCISNPTESITINSQPSVSITGPSAICIGSTSTLSPTTGGTWTSSNSSVATVSNAGLVTAISGGTVTFTFIQTSTGCTSNPTASITINPRPTVSVTGPTSICIGVTSNLSPSTGGTWSSSNSAVATVSNAGLVTGIAAGNVTFTFTQTSTACISNPTSSITVNARPTVSITGPNNICVGATTNLSPSTDGTWTSSNASIATVSNSGLVTGISAGSTTFTFTLIATGCVSNASAAVTISPRPIVSVTGSSPICIGETSSVSPTTGGTWVSSNPSVASIVSSGLITGLSSGSAVFTFTQTSTGCVSNATSAISVNSRPVVNISGSNNLCIGNTTSLTPSNGGTWVSSNSSMASVTNAGIVTALSPGSVTFVFTQTSTGCVSNNTNAVQINDRPPVIIVGPTSICVGSITTLTPLTGGTWVSSNPAVATISNTGIVTGVAEGTASFIFTSSVTNCPSQSSGTITVLPLPIEGIGGITQICIGGTLNLSSSTAGTWASVNPSVASVTSNGLVTGISQGNTNFLFTQTSTGCRSSASGELTVSPKPIISITGPTSICRDLTTVLTPSTGGTWVSSNNNLATITNGGVVTGINAGQATFIFTSSSTGCSSESSLPITIHSKPVISLIGPSNICVGSNASFTPTTGGTWSSNNSSVASINNLGIVTGLTPGNTSFVFTNSVTGCVSENSSSITVGPGISASINNNSTACLTDSTSLNAVLSGGTSPFSYNWIGPNGFTSSSNNISVVSSGIYNLSINDSYGCTSSASTTILPEYTPTLSASNYTVCAGENVTLTASGTSTIAYQWDSNASFATSQTVVVLPYVPFTNYSVLMTNSNGCISLKNITINVNQKPSPIITGNSSICVGGNTQLTPNSGGTWISNNPTIASINNSGFVTALQPGNATFQFTSSSSGCVSNASSVVTANSNPNILLTGPSAICIGANTYLTPTTGGIWTSNNPSVATITTSGQVFGVSGGMTSFVFTSSNTGCSSIPSSNIQVDTLIILAILGSNTTCEGNTVQLTSPISGGFWSSSNTSVATINNFGLVSSLSAGNTIIKYTKNSGSCINEATHNFQVNTKPIVSISGPSPICVGSTTSLSPSSGGIWTSSNPSVASVTNSGEVMGLSSGLANFTFVSNTNSCISNPTSNLTVNPIPSLNIGGASTICVGATTSVLPSINGLWTSTNPTIASVNSTGVVTGLLEGSATIIFTQAGCASSPTAPINIVGYNVALTGSSSLCVGGTSTLSPSSGGAWSSSNSSIASVTNAGVITGVSNGIATFTFTDFASGCVNQVGQAVTVSSSPVTSVSGPSIICIGSTTNFIPSSGGTWVSNNPAVATITNGGQVTGISQGATTFVFTQSAGCVSSSSASITVNGKPTVTLIGNPSICVGAITNLIPSTGGTWTSSNPTIATISNSGLVTGISPGNVSFTFTELSSGCTSNPSQSIEIKLKPIISITGVNTICAGSTTTLSPSTGGTWTSSNNAIAAVSNSGVVYGVSPGQVNFTFLSSASECLSDPTVTVTVLNKPVVGFSGSNTICNGLGTTLTPNSGGTWTSSNTNVAIITNTGNATSLASGSATFTFTSTAGCVSNPSSTLNVLPRPTVSISGPNNICVGATTSLLPSIGGTWISNNPAIASINNSGLVNSIAEGIATFIFTETSTGCISNISLPITIAAVPTVNVSGPSQMCVGTTIALTPSTGGSWVSNNLSVATVTSSGIVSGISNGVAIFTFVSSNNCSATGSLQMNINSRPTVNFSGPTSICIGASTNILPSTDGMWLSNNPSIAIIDNSGLITGITAGNASFTYTNIITGCASNISSNITVNAKPVVNISGPSTICVGNFTTLSPTVGGTWMSNNNSIASISNVGLVTGISAGTTTFTFTNTITGCGSNPSSSIVINPKPIAQIVGINPVCVGLSSTLSPSSEGSWISSNPAVATVSINGIINSISAGTANFTFTSSSTGCISSTTGSIIVKAIPIVELLGLNQICAGGTTSFTPSTGGTWLSNNPTVATIVNSGIVNAISQGTAIFTFTNTESGCSSNPSMPITVTSGNSVIITGQGDICVGHTINLTPTSGGIWISNNPNIATISASGLVTGKLPGRVSFTFLSTSGDCNSSTTSDTMRVKTCIVSDFNSTSINIPLIGNVKTNDNVPLLTIYGSVPTLISKPIGSTETLLVNFDGIYVFTGNKVGEYVYQIPVCITGINVNCPTSELRIKVYDESMTGSQIITVSDIGITYAGNGINQPGTPIVINPLLNDFCVNSGGCTLNPGSISFSSYPLNGSVSVDSYGNITYTPNSGFKGFDTIFYKIYVTGEPENWTTGTIIIQVLAVSDSNFNITAANDDFYVTYKETPISNNVTFNDIDPEGDNQTVYALGTAEVPMNVPGGKYWINQSGEFTFIPSPGFVGSTSFVYTICDDNPSLSCVNATANIIVVNDLLLKVRVYLEGAIYNCGNEKSYEGRPLMRDNLRLSPHTGLNYIPLSDPYTFSTEFIDVTHNFPHVKSGLNTRFNNIINPSQVFSVIGQNAIVDWVYIELRSKLNYSTVIATRSGLLQRDGDVVDVDGVSLLAFPGVSPDQYYVVVRHRSHLGAMTQLVQSSSFIDFVSFSTPVFDFGTSLSNGIDFSGTAMNLNIAPGYRALWAGDFDNDGKIKFTNPSDDQNILFFDVFSSPNNSSGFINFDFGFGYFQGDYDMNGKVKFENPNDDKNLLFGQLLLHPLNNEILANFNTFIEQVPPKNQ